MEISESKIESKPSADIKLSQGNEGIIQNESFPVIPKKLDKGDFYRTVKHSELFTIDSHASKPLEVRTKWDEIIMTLCGIGFGATISVLFSSVELETTLGIIFFVLIPILSFSGSVFVIMFKLMNLNNERNSVQEIRNIVESHLTKSEE